MPNKVWDFHVTGHSLFRLHISTKKQTGAGEAASQPKKLVFLFLCLGWIDLMRKWENWEKFFWHLKYFLSRIGTQTPSLIEAVTTFSSQASPIWSLGRGVRTERDTTISLWNLDRTGPLVQKLLCMNKHRHRHSHFDCSRFILFRHLDWKCEGREREQ